MTDIFDFRAEQLHSAMEAELAKRSPPPIGLCPVSFVLASREYCARTLMKGSTYCYWHTPDNEKYKPEKLQDYFGEGVTLAQALEKEVVEGQPLQGAYLANARLGGDWFRTGCSLKGGHFVRANLSGAHLSYSDLTGANFAYADLRRAYLSSCRIHNVRFVGTKLFEAKFRDNDFQGIIGLRKENFKGSRGWLPIFRMLEDYPDQSEGVYRALVSYFTSTGLLDDASWAAYRGAVMRHRVLTKQLSPVHRWASVAVERALDGKEMRFGRFQFRTIDGQWFLGLCAWGRSLVLRFLMGYGEKPLRVALSAASAIMAYALTYTLFGGIRGFADSLYLSMIVFTALSDGGIPKRGPLRFIIASEALVGMLLLGLFLFCIGRRSVRRG